MHPTIAMAEIGALVGDPGRANMLAALLDGRALTAKELAGHAGVTPQTASGHLSRLLVAQLITVERQGRHRYHRLASADVARMIEGMLFVAQSHTELARAPVRAGPKDAALRNARTCYDHFAGRLGVGLMDSLVACGHLHMEGDAGVLSPDGERRLRELGIDVAAAAGSKRVFCRFCLDWSERRPHLAGVLGSAIMERVFALHWARRMPGTRAIEITIKGEQGLRDTFGLSGLRLAAAG